jgi:hypothetical protein
LLRRDFELIPSVKRWNSRLQSKRSPTYRLMSWCKWLESKGLTWHPDELIKIQGAAVGDERFKLLDLLQEFVAGSDLRAASKQHSYACVKSFFMHNRCDLPQDKSFKISSDYVKVEGMLTVDVIRQIVLRSNACYKALFLSMLSGGMGLGEVVYWSDNGLPSLLTQLENGAHPVKVNLPGRKKGRGTHPFYTFIGSDAIKALKQYFELYPHNSKAIFLNQFGDPITRSCIRLYWNRQLDVLGLKGEPQGKGKMMRYGMNPHEFRDVFRSRWEKSGAPGAAAEFMMGHVVDKNEYNKAYNDVDFATQAYFQAEDWLNILSHEPDKIPRAEAQREIYKIRHEQDERIAKLEEYMRQSQALKKDKEKISEIL